MVVLVSAAEAPDRLGLLPRAVWLVARVQRSRVEPSAPRARCQGHPEPADMRAADGVFDRTDRNSYSAIRAPWPLSVLRHVMVAWARDLRAGLRCEDTTRRVPGGGLRIALTRDTPTGRDRTRTRAQLRNIRQVASALPFPGSEPSRGAGRRRGTARTPLRKAFPWQLTSHWYTAEPARLAAPGHCRSTPAWRTRPGCTTTCSAARTTTQPTGRPWRHGSRPTPG